MIRTALCALLAFGLPAAAQYPERPVTLLAGYPPGGLVDVVARLVAEGMKAKFPRGIAVVNGPVDAGSVAVAELARSQPDGYTVVLTPHSALVIAAQINDLAYKTPDDYDPFINLVAYYPMIAVRTESLYQSIQELIADARANPGKIRVGSPGEGTSRRWWRSPASSKDRSTASACEFWSRSSRSATRCSPTCRRRRSWAGTWPTACGTCSWRRRRRRRRW